MNSRPSSARQAVVVGGGVIGAACAHFLRASGWRVTVIDRERFGAGCSDGSCGYVCPSHVLPLAEPGAIRQAIRALVRKNSPFSIKPRLDPALWTWLIHFALRCNHEDMLAAGRACRPLLDTSIALYRKLVAEKTIDCEWEERGLLFVYRSSHAMEEYAAIDRILGEHFHRAAKRIDGDALTGLEPALKPGLAGGWHYEGDAHVRPDKLLSSWRVSLEKAGVEIREHCAMTGFARDNGCVRAVQTAGGDIPADAVVMATGALTPTLGRHLGCAIPIQPGKGYSLTMPRPAICPKIPILFPETRVGVTPLRAAYRLASTMEFAGYDDSIRPQRLQLLKDGAAPYLREPFCEPVIAEWFGWRPMTWDGIPIIGRCPALKNVILAAGHNMLGLSMAPATGKLVAELLDGTATPQIDPRPYALERFS